ncbi:ORF2 [Grizzly bear anellovirus 6]|nr:ORF2 [Grizzly bear anellovirus 6]
MLAFHRRNLITFKKKEAQWKQTCSAAHKLFCDCGDWLNHLRPCLTVTAGAGGVSPGEGISFITEEGDSGDAGDEGTTGVDAPQR